MTQDHSDALSGPGLRPCGAEPQASQAKPLVPIADEYDYDDGLHDCYECGGEGFVSNCVEEWACLDPEYGCDYCTRRCPLCNPAKRDPALDAVLAEALAAQGMSAGTAKTPQAVEGEARQPGPKDAPNLLIAPHDTKEEMR